MLKDRANNAGPKDHVQPRPGKQVSVVECTARVEPKVNAAETASTNEMLTRLNLDKS